MALEGNAFNRTAAPAATRPEKARPFIRLGQVVYQLLSVKEKVEKSYDTRHLPDTHPEQVWVKKISFKFVLVRADRNEEKGHGRFFWKDANKPQYGVQRPVPGKKVSNIYTLLTKMLNDGAPLTDEQLGVLPAIINELEATQAQFYGMNDGDPSTGKNWLGDIIGRVPEDEELEKWVPAERKADPREADDDPSIVCTVTGEPIHGWAKSDGAWVDNREWLTMMKAKLGEEAIYMFPDHPGKFFAPPFCSRLYREAKAQAEKNLTNTPF